MNDLSPQDRRDLADYYQFLRHYFAVSDRTPIFPTNTATTTAGTVRSSRRSPAARNRADHPWRAPVHRTGAAS